MRGSFAVGDGVDHQIDVVMVRAAEWLVRLRSREARGPDYDALTRWRLEDPEHDAAYRRIEATSSLIKSVGLRYRAEHTFEIHDAATQTRRAVLGTIAAGVSAAGLYVAARALPRDRRLNFETATAERRSLALARGVSVDLDARSAIVLDRAGGDLRIGLQEGRVEVKAAVEGWALRVALGLGTVAARRARFDVELFGGHGCVTCLTGTLVLDHPLGTRSLTAGQRVTFSNDALAAPAAIDVAEAEAWKNGWLIYRGVPLARVVADVGRYRHGRIILADPTLAGKPVTGTFRIDRIDAAIDQIAQLTATRRIALPGGFLVLV